MTEIPITVSNSDDTKRKRQLRKSGWLVTIASNKKYTGTESHLQEAEDALVNAVEQVMGNRENIPAMLPLRPKAAEEHHEYNSNYFKEIMVKVGEPELGPESRILHVHVLMIIRHYTLISLNTKFLQKSISELLGMGVYVNQKLIPANIENVREYIHKNYKAK